MYKRQRCHCDLVRVLFGLRRPSVPLTEEVMAKLEARAKKERRTVANLLSGIIEDEFLKGQDD